MSCAIWQTAAEELPPQGDFQSIRSPRTDGGYIITGSAIPYAAGLTERQKARLTTWLVDQRRHGVQTPRIDTSIIEFAKVAPRTSVPERVDRLLLWLEAREPFVGGLLSVGSDMLYSAQANTESISGNELWSLFRMLEERGWGTVRQTSTSIEAHILVGGYERIDELRAKQIASSQGFVAMWFDPAVDDAWESGIRLGIIDAGYSPLRIDKKHHNNRIDDEMIAEIRRSRFLVADFTHGEGGARGGVYYEAGFAQGLGLPVIFTVREDLLNAVHFDTRQYPHIVWKTPDDLRAKLAARISATIGDGPSKPGI